MATDKSLIPILQKRKLELLKELQAIDVLLQANGGSDAAVPSAVKSAGAAPKTKTIYGGGMLGYRSTRDEHIAMLQQKTDDITWKNYILKALEILGAASAVDIIDLINDTNDHKIPDQRVKEATAAALRDLSKMKKVGKQAGNSKEGQSYYPIPSPPAKEISPQ
jgi:hypothetical protein